MKKCLIVDDSKVVRNFSEKILKELGFECTQAENGVDALAKIDNANPDFILLDWNMPEMDGLEFMKKVREQEKYKNIKIIFCTTENEIHKVQQAVVSGADEYIMKPYDIEIVRNKLIQTGIL